jgi:hypothetical protein
MSYLLFMDESGHDRRTMPYEVHGGVAIHSTRLWAFIQAMQDVEVRAFGCRLQEFDTEIKGHKLLDKDRFRWAAQAEAFDDPARQKLVRSFLSKGKQGRQRRRDEFTAYGQACLMMAREIFRLLRDHAATLFAAAIPREVKKPPGATAAEFLRKDQVFLLERFFYFLEEKREPGLLVMDETEKKEDARFVSRLQRYFTQTQTGRYRTHWIVPAPLFVSSDMSYGVQAADVCIYCINWGFRVHRTGMTAPERPEIHQEFGPWLGRLQYAGEGYRDGRTFQSYGIVYVPDPYTAR